MDQCEKPTGNQNVLIAAIDFGTAYSGYAFSSHEDFRKDPLNIFIPEWSKVMNLRSPKIPSCILFNEHQNVVEFGYEAEKQFTSLSEQNGHEKYYFFQNFKMLLHRSSIGEDKPLSEQIKLKDINGKEMLATDVFSGAIKYLKNDLLKTLEDKGINQQEEEIRWILTVPAIWEDPAKNFMRVAAEQAGIRGECLVIALEPEAASMYCKMQSIAQSKKGIHKFEPGSRYLIMDAGGGTVDVTIHEVLKDGNINELNHATGGAWGGTYVDEQFHKMLKDILGENLFNEYKREFLADYIQICQQLEIGKRSFSKKSRQFQISLPASLIGKCKAAGSEWQDLVQKSSFKKFVTCKGERLRLEIPLVEDLFSEVCDRIVEHVKKLLDEHKIKTVLMVGGFSESQYLQDKMEEDLPKDVERVIPTEAGLAVLKGAVLFGQRPNTIKSRKARYSYGVQTYMRFNPKVHPEGKRENIEGTDYCVGVFSKHVTIGQNLNIDEAQEKQSYFPISDDQTAIRFHLYYSTEENPQYVEDCTHLGELNVDISDMTDKSRNVQVSFMFGDTELKVECTNEHTGKKTEGKFNYFSSNPVVEKQYVCKE